MKKLIVDAELTTLTRDPARDVRAAWSPERRRPLMRSMVRTLALATALGILALLAPRAEAIIVDFKFGLVGVVFDFGQAVQINITHIGDPHVAPASCDTLVEFVHVSGELLKTTHLIVPVGQSQAADLGVSELIPLKGKVPIYARVAIDHLDDKLVCRPSLEVFDKGTGRTAVAVGEPALGGVPEVFFPAFTLVTGQAVRLNAVNMGDPDLAPCPLVLTIFAADGTVLGQRQAIVPSGAGTFLDVALSGPDSRVQIRGALERAVDVRPSADRSLCRAFVSSVEVYDAITGITSLIVGDPDL